MRCINVISGRAFGASWRSEREVALGDWIDDFVDATAGQPSPLIFRKWAAISAIAGSLERRCYVMSARKPIFPNLYVLLVATPGVGKNIIQDIHNLWFDSKTYKVSPLSITKAGLVDALAEAGTVILPGNKDGEAQEMIEYHAMLVASPEFGVFVSSHDLDFLSSLNNIYDNPPVYSERRRHVHDGKTFAITNPQLTILAGTQPGFLSSVLPEEAWSMGTTSRLIMVYSGEPVQVKLHLEVAGEAATQEAIHRAKLWQGLLDRLKALHDLLGPILWTREAAQLAEAWYIAKCPPVPTHSKLLHYCTRRFVHALKLAQISVASRGQDMVLRQDDWLRALSWLGEAEARMPDIFREMSAKSDHAVILELHSWMWATWAKSNQALPEVSLVDFLQRKLPSERILRVIEIAEKSGTISRMAGSRAYVPRPKNAWGLE